jgi:hypothetical protein
MCFSGTIDALYKKNDGTKYILRGRHYYPLDNPSQAVEALEIAKSLGISEAVLRRKARQKSQTSDSF